MVKVILLTIIIVAVSILLLVIKIFFVKDGRFPKTHIGDNPDMKKRGITCALSTDYADRNTKGLHQ